MAAILDGELGYTHICTVFIFLTQDQRGTISVYFADIISFLKVIKVQNSPIILCTDSPGLNFSCRCQNISTKKTITLKKKNKQT